MTCPGRPWRVPLPSWQSTGSRYFERPTDRPDFTDAACGGMDPNIWHPEDSGRTGAGRNAVALAVAICETCPVKDACGQWGIDAREPDGIWGGLTPEERKQARRRERYAANRLGRTGTVPQDLEEAG